MQSVFLHINFYNTWLVKHGRSNGEEGGEGHGEKALSVVFIDWRKANDGPLK